MSVGNPSGKIGMGKDICRLLWKKFYGLVATAQVGFYYKDGFGISTKAKASVLSSKIIQSLIFFCSKLNLVYVLVYYNRKTTISIFPTDYDGKQLVRESEFLQ